MQSQDLERIRFVTRNYVNMRGLAWVGVGVVLFCCALDSATWHGTESSWLATTLGLVLYMAGLALLFFYPSYYRKTVGEVQMPARAKLRNWTDGFGVGMVPVSLLLVWVGFAPAEFSSFFKSFANNAWLLCYLGFGGVFLGIWIWRECRLSQFHHLALGGLLLSLAATGRAPVFLVPPFSTGGSALLRCGAAMILAGLLDHWQLVRVLGPSSAALYEESNDAEPLEVQR